MPLNSSQAYQQVDDAIRPKLSMIVAMARNQVIGIENRLPWHLPEDLKHFRSLTMGHHLIMGRKTFESIGRPLPGRTTVIVTRDSDYRVEGCLIAHSIEQAIELSRTDSEVFFVGGSTLYAQTLAMMDRLYITEIQAEYQGDAHFPEFDRSVWHELTRENRRTEDGLGYAFVSYTKGNA